METRKANLPQGRDAKLQVQSGWLSYRNNKVAWPFLLRGNKMKELILLLIFLLILLAAVASAFAQEWFEAAESSSPGYELTAGIDDCQSSILNNSIAKKVERLPKTSGFTHTVALPRGFEKGIPGAAAGPRGDKKFAYPQ